MYCLFIIIFMVFSFCSVHNLRGKMFLWWWGQVLGEKCSSLYHSEQTNYDFELSKRPGPSRLLWMSWTKNKCLIMWDKHPIFSKRISMNHNSHSPGAIQFYRNHTNVPFQNTVTLPHIHLLMTCMKIFRPNCNQKIMTINIIMF